MHILSGFPADPKSAPSWVRFDGCAIDEERHDRRCEYCGHSWIAPQLPVENGETEAGCPFQAAAPGAAPDLQSAV
jgi:hypothetical protein